VEKSNAVVYVVDSLNEFEFNLIKKLTDLLKNKILIIVHNFCRSVEEIELNAGYLSQFFKIMKNSTGQYCIPNTEVYHLFTVN